MCYSDIARKENWQKSLFLPKKWFFEQIRRKPTVEKRLYMFQNDRNTGFRLSTCCQTEQNLHRFISILPFFVSIYPKLEHICNVLHCFISGVFEETIKILEFRSVLLMGTWKIFVFSYIFLAFKIVLLGSETKLSIFLKILAMRKRLRNIF